MAVIRDGDAMSTSGDDLEVLDCRSRPTSTACSTTAGLADDERGWGRRTRLERACTVESLGGESCSPRRRDLGLHIVRRTLNEGRRFHGDARLAAVLA